MMTQITEEHKALQEAVERLYNVFARYPLRRDTEMCDCCHKPEDEQKLHAKPLKDLSAEDLEKYAWSALLTWGSVEDFKHFLPRIFEIIGEEGSFGWPDTPIVFAKLHYAEWRSWPDDEQAAVTGYLMALWRYCLTLADEDIDIDDLLCGIARAVDDLTPYLAEWRRSGWSGYRLLAGYINEQFDTIAKRHRLHGPYWRDTRKTESPFIHDRTEQMNQVIDWLLDPATKLMLEEAYFSNPSDAHADEIASSVDTLGYLAKLYTNKREKA